MRLGLHHLHVRKRLYKHLSPYPHPVFWKRLFDHFMYAVAIISPLSVLPQVFQLFSTHNASGLSLTTWVLGNLINFSWLAYAWIHKATPILVSSAIFVVLNILMVYGILVYS